MRKNSIFNKRFLFITILILIYISFIYLDLTDGIPLYANILKFTVIIICFCYALFSESNNKSISYSLKAAMFFTLISDLFILILDYYIYGVLTFIIVQLLYNYRISCYSSSYKVQYNSSTKEQHNRSPKAEHNGYSKEQFKSSYKTQDNNGYKERKQKNTAAESNNKKELIKNKTGFVFISRLLIQLLIAALICLILHLSGVALELLPVISVIYFTGLLVNTLRALYAVIKGDKEPGMILFATGLVLFVMCDINVCLFNLTDFITVPEQTYLLFYNISSVLIWVFYAPSQALITLSIEKGTH